MVSSGLETVPISLSNGNGNSSGNVGVNFPFELVFIFGIFAIGGLAVVYVKKGQKKQNIEIIVSHAGKKQKELLADLREVTNYSQGSATNSSKLPATDQPKPKRRNRQRKR